LVWSGRAQLASLAPRDVVLLSMRSVLVLVIGEFMYIVGLRYSNLTTMSYTALAFPAVAIVLDVFLRREAISSLFAPHSLIGIALLVVGFLLLMSGRK
jgi:hypothetical protein